MVELRIQKIDNDLPTIKYAHDGDAGLDLYASTELMLPAGTAAIICCGFSMALPKGYCAFVQPRSGLAIKYGITITNSPGLIDCHYRGEVKVILHNTGVFPFYVNRGDRIAQMVIMKIPDVMVVEVDKLDDTERGQGGFGSTGK